MKTFYFLKRYSTLEYMQRGSWIQFSSLRRKTLLYLRTITRISVYRFCVCVGGRGLCVCARSWRTYANLSFRQMRTPQPLTYLLLQWIKKACQVKSSLAHFYSPTVIPKPNL